MRAPIVLSLLCAAGSSFALPNPDTRFRPGANHHLGDDSFVATHHRTPGEGDTEKARMKDHLQFVRGWLGGRAATRPELAARRAELLGYLDEYIARGITPTNAHLPWRTPVFIDDNGAICAVGYLIERDVGRALPEQIAATHRYDYLEDIARELPEVAAWIAGSGFTLDELASIQPGYSEPEAHTWQRWQTAGIPDGAYRSSSMRESASVGRFANHRMEGEWKTFAAEIEQDRGPRPGIDERAAVIGRGTLRDGSGRWTSYYDDGTLLATGQFANNHPTGTWRFYHPSGNLAAIGELRRGTRAGRWEFFHDAAKRTRIATGRFDGGRVAGVWRHYDPAGTLIAVSRTETPWRRPSGLGNTSDGEVIEIVPGPDRIRHAVSIGTVDGELQRLDTFALGRERIYVYAFPWAGQDELYDDRGHMLARDGDGWTAADCHWGRKRTQIAAAGEVAWLHGLLHRDRLARGYQRPEPRCATPRPVGEARGKRLTALLASRDRVRSVPPRAIRDLVLGDTQPQYLDDDTRAASEDMTKLIVKHMGFYVEWPHVDGRFIQVFRTLPGHVRRYWWDDMDAS